jgi:hypothetical protein
MHDGTTPRISNGGLLVVLRFVFLIIVSVPGQVIALNSATAHTRKRLVASCIENYAYKIT